MGTPEEFAAMITFVEQHQIIPIIDKVYDLEDANSAFSRMKEGGSFGKLVLKHVPNESDGR